jgi:subtilisin family serine protease
VRSLRLGGHRRATGRTVGWRVAATAATATVIVTAVAFGASAWAEQQTGTIRDAGGPTALSGNYIVILKDGTVAAGGVDAVAGQLAAKHGGLVRRTWQDALLGFDVSMSEAAARRLAAEPKVAYVEQNHVMRIADTQNDPPSYGLDRIDEASDQLDGRYNFPNTASNVHVYIIDTGIRMSHKDFGGRAESGFDFVNGGEANDCDGHGTHVAATAGGKTFGVAKEAKLVSVRVLDCDGSASTAEFIAGVNFVARNAVKPAVANASIGGRKLTSVSDAIRRVVASGVTFVIAAGNGGTDACDRGTAGIQEAIAVGATDRLDRRASFSNFGSCVDVFAPGVDIVSATNANDRGTKKLSGTSMAAPHVTGAAAIVLAAHPEFTPAQVRDFLVEHATIGVVGRRGAGSPDRLLHVTS